MRCKDRVVQATQLDPDVEAQLRAADFTYDLVGGTSGVLPDGYGQLNRRMILGFGMARFAEASLRKQSVFEDHRDSMPENRLHPHTGGVPHGRKRIGDR